MTRLARFAWLVLAWNVVVILWGAFVRATGSGAGCGAHWPLCNGEIVPRAPGFETMVELTHRVTSGAALLLVLALVLFVFREKPRGHLARRAAVAALAFILGEVAVGAGLVLFRLVAADESVARALFMAVHLVDTFLLLASLALTAHWSASDAPLRREALARHGWPFGSSALALLAVGETGAVAALGDTLYPAQSLLDGLAQDLSPTLSALVRMRVAHPVVALAAALLVIFTSARVLQTTGDIGTRRAAGAVAVIAIVQVAAGLADVASLAPVWMQLVHLLLADVLWIAFVLFAVRVGSLRPQAEASSAESPSPAA